MFWVKHHFVNLLALSGLELHSFRILVHQWFLGAKDGEKDKY